MRLFEGTPLDRPPRCERCGELEQECTCPATPTPALDPKKQTIRIAVEKRKKGKVVTVIRDFAGEKDQIAALLQKLKSACGAGGTCQGAELEIQGSHMERIRELLTAIGYRVRG